jgi:hypothetical protein
MRKSVLYFAKPLCFLLIISFALLDLSVQTARAGMIGTETIMNTEAGMQSRAEVLAFLERQDVQRMMTRQGVNPEEAKMRVASLSDAEVARLSQVIDRMPAGGDASTWFGVALLIFFVILISDLLGYTNILPFVRSPAR